ncbi:MAG TPA: CdaR family protein [Vicinamibacterales bacterium]
MAYHPFRHLGLKVLSIAMAVALWVLVGNQRAVERTVRVPLEFHNLPPDLELVASPPDTVEVRLRGASGTLGRLPPGEVVAVLDLTGAREGTRLFHLLLDEVQVPFGVEVTQIIPPTVSLTFERSLTRTVPVVPAVDGEPAAGYTVGRIKSDPERVAVVGPASQVEGVTSATTEPVSVAGASSTVVDRVTVGVENELVRLREPLQATVTVEVVPVAVERQVSGIPVVTRTLGDGLGANVDPSTVSVILKGPADRLDVLPAVVAFVDLAGLARGRYELPVRVDPLPGVEVIRTQPVNVTVRIR